MIYFHFTLEKVYINLTNVPNQFKVRISSFCLTTKYFNVYIKKNNQLLKKGWKGVTTINTNNLFNIIDEKHCILSYKAGHSFKYGERTKGKTKM